MREGGGGEGRCGGEKKEKRLVELHSCFGLDDDCERTDLIC